MSDSVISLSQVDFHYEHLSVLENINLEVAKGEFLGIVGPNAGGKSTLLKIILGQLTPGHGKVRVYGKSPAAARQQMGYVPQYPGFDRDFPITVEQVVLMGTINRHAWIGGYSRQDRQRAAEALDRVQALSLAQRQINTLSGGQLQRILLARALACDPGILILDEPTSNIDMRLENDIFDLLKALNKDITILVVSHDIAFISSYVNRVACLNRSLVCHHTDAIDGKTIQELYDEDVRMVAHHH